ncbi:MAG TPA: D-glycerate dehydrogenase [Bryobacteraceae bacterium]|nr:D-glycerate dehydrogenase [Bryobacteraceae bacterium]
MKPAVLVTKRIYPEAVHYLSEHCEIDDVGTDDGLTAEELKSRVRGKQAVISQLTDRFSADVIERLEDVKIIANVAVGFDNIDVPAATRKGILVTNTPDVLTETTADFAFALLLAAARRVVEAHQFVHAGQWKKWAIDLLVGQDVHHRTLGLFGMGRIGQAMARRGRGFSMRILYNDAVRAPEAIERELQLEFVPAERLLREADFVSLHVPLLDSTRKLIGEPQLRLMKKTAILVNTARGPVVDEAALGKALAEGWIAGAGLDVFEHEPQVHPELLKLKNVVVAPHIASASVDTRREMSMLAARNVVDALEGRRPLTLLNPQLWDSLSARKAV